MSLDIRTIFCALSVASCGLAGAMLLYAFTQKTFPGFRDWAKGAGLVALGYILLLLRGAIPEIISVLVGNLGFVLGLTYVLVGVRRFLGLPPQRFLLWLVSLAFLAGMAFFLWVAPDPVWRAMVVSLAVFLVGVRVALLLGRHAPPGHLALYLITGLMICLLGFGGLVRTVYLLILHPGHLLLAGNWLHASYFLVALFAQLFMVVGLLLINSQRLGDELNQSRSRLSAVAETQRRILDFLPDPTWVVDAMGRITHWNQAMEKLTGVPAGQVLGKGEFEHAVFLYGERRPCLIDLMIKHDPVWESRYHSLERRGDSLVTTEAFLPDLGEDGMYVAGSATTLFDEQGQVAGAIETLRDITQHKRHQQERERLIAELTEALEKVKTLKGLIPICSHCKSIRHDEGYWQQLESFISQHSDVEFSHGICPDCLEKYYKELDHTPSNLGKGSHSDDIG